VRRDSEAVYLYYEVFGESDLDVNNHVYEFVCSSDGKSNKIEFFRPTQKGLHTMISQMFKSIDLNSRSWDQSTFVTTLIGYAGRKMVVTVESAVAGGILKGLNLKKITDLQAKVRTQTLNYIPPPPRPGVKPVEVKFKEEDFFYKDATPKGELSGEALQKAVASILLLDLNALKTRTESELKKQYRLRAMALHPDRNGGDSSQMAELNRLWTLYNKN
jgi:hypothetical protein